MGTADDKLIAIDVLLEPDRTMTDKSKALNARLRENYQAGYALDATHLPHVTLLQRFVRAKDFDAVTAAIAKVLVVEQPTAMKLRTNRLDYGLQGWPWVSSRSNARLNWDGCIIRLPMRLRRFQ
jgi:hypothetical protein